MDKLLNAYRSTRVLLKQIALMEPLVLPSANVKTEYHGSVECGWHVQSGKLDRNSVVVDVGLGEDISFSRTLIERYGLTVHGFDPTPRAIAYVQKLNPPNFVLHQFGIGARSGTARFFLPNNDRHVSGSIVREEHVGGREIEVSLLGLEDIFARIGTQRIDLLKLDVEGAEYDVLAGEQFARLAPSIGMLCIEFHHRWKSYGRTATLDAVEKLRSLGFECAWRSASSNEEFLFVKRS